MDPTNLPTPASDGGLGSARAVYPGTFDPFTPGHFDVVDRSRRMFDQVTVLVAVNDGKRPSQATAVRAREIRVRNSTDCMREYELAAMNEVMGVTTLFVPARPELATMSSTAMRALRA